MWGGGIIPICGKTCFLICLAGGMSIRKSCVFDLLDDHQWEWDCNGWVRVWVDTCFLKIEASGEAEAQR